MILSWRKHVGSISIIPWTPYSWCGWIRHLFQMPLKGIAGVAVANILMHNNKLYENMMNGHCQRIEFCINDIDVDKEINTKVC